MNIQELIRAIMAEQEVTLDVLGSRIGVGRSAVCNALGATQRSMGFDRAANMLDALNYELVAVPKGTKLPKGGYRVEQRGVDE